MAIAPKKQKVQVTEVPTLSLTIGQVPVQIRSAPINQHVLKLLERARQKTQTWVITLNWEMITRALLDPSYAQYLTQADWIIPDGFPVVLWLRLCHPKETPRPSRVAGVELVDKIFDSIRNDPNFKIAIVGGSNLHEVLERLRFPKERVVLLFDGKVDVRDSAQVEFFAGKISQGGARLVFLALGVPKQDLLANSLHQRLPGITTIGVGGTFAFLAGFKRRAPRWMQESGLEWLFRLVTEPGLSYRYLIYYPKGFLRLLYNWILKIIKPK